MSGLVIGDPVTLSTALASGKVVPGDVLLLRAGTYAKDYTVDLAGTSELPITIKAYDKERVIINGNFLSNGSYITYRDVEFTFLNWTSRVSAESGPAPSDIPSSSVTVNSPYNKFINCIFHDLSGSGIWTPSLGTDFHGCVVFHNGWSGLDRGHGHGYYIQNDTPEKIIKDCIILDTFGWGIHAYTEKGKINNITLEGNTCFRSGSLYGAAYNPILVGGEVTADNPKLIANMTFGAAVNLGYSLAGGFTNAILTNNYFPNGISKIGNVQTIASESGNYYGLAVGNQAFVRPNDYQSDRANVTIYNQAEADTVSVDLSAVTGLGVGNSVKVRNVQDYFVDIQTLTLDAQKKITVNMQAANRTVSSPVQWTAPATTFPDFGCFVVEKA